MKRLSCQILLSRKPPYVGKPSYRPNKMITLGSVNCNNCRRRPDTISS